MEYKDLRERFEKEIFTKGGKILDIISKWMKVCNKIKLKIVQKSF